MARWTDGFPLFPIIVRHYVLLLILYDLRPSYPVRWDPNRENLLHFEQSAELYTSYFYSIIMLHRPFISEAPKSSIQERMSALEICTQAAISCSRIATSLVQRSKILSPHVQFTAFSSGVVLLTNIWGQRKRKKEVNISTLLGHLQECVWSLRSVEKRSETWHAYFPLSINLYFLS